MSSPSQRLPFWAVIALFPALTWSSENHEWTQWRGPNRDGKSPETGLLKKWPAAGPKLIWMAKGVGQGFSSVTIKDGLLYTAGVIDQQCYVFALDLQGKHIWKAKNGEEWKEPKKYRWARGRYNGSRATPTINDGLVYHLNAIGHLTAFNAKSGKAVWAIDVKENFQGKYPGFGYSESVLIDGKNLICYPGGAKGYIVALNKKTGKTVWANTTIKDTASHASPILVEDQGVRQIITGTMYSILGVNADTGELLWKHKNVTRFKENCETPVYDKGVVYVTAGTGIGSKGLKLTYAKDRVSVSLAWHNKRITNSHGGIILLGSHIYGPGYKRAGWFCLDTKTGKQTNEIRSLMGKGEKGFASKGCITYADGMLYCFGSTGGMALIKPTPEKFEMVSQFTIPLGDKTLCFAHPAICGARLYLRRGSNLYAYDIRAH